MRYLGLELAETVFLDFNNCTEQDVEVEGAMAADHLNAKFINLDLDLNKVQGKIMNEKNVQNDDVDVDIIFQCESLFQQLSEDLIDKKSPNLHNEIRY